MQYCNIAIVPVAATGTGIAILQYTRVRYSPRCTRVHSVLQCNTGTCTGTWYRSRLPGMPYRGQGTQHRVYVLEYPSCIAIVLQYRNCFFNSGTEKPLFQYFANRTRQGPCMLKKYSMVLRGYTQTETRKWCLLGCCVILRPMLEWVVTR